MPDAVRQDVERHYTRGAILESIDRALRQAGKDPLRIAPPDLAPVDQFHTRGREATIELAQRVDWKPGLRVLDVGSGLGGSARFLAVEYGCDVTGVDLTAEYVDVANTLAQRVGLADRVKFRQANALALPFDDASFDVVWTEHVQMNIPDKRAFYGEISRVLAPRGRLLFHDVFEGDGAPLRFPVPWASEPSISFLAPPDAVRATLAAVGLEVRAWEDKTTLSADWLEAMAARVRASGGPPPLGLHLLTGETHAAKFANYIANLREGRVVVVQAVAEKVRG